MNNQKMLDVVTMIANIILPDKCDHESAVEIWLRAMQRKAREALESCEREPVGNAAAMRAALYMMRRISDEMNGETFGKGDEEIVKGWANTLRYYSDKALSEPPRNCDVGTAKEQTGRFLKFCDIHDCESDCPLFKANSCELAWAQMPYEAEEGDATDGK